MCEVPASLAGVVQEECNRAASRFVAECTVAAEEYRNKFTPTRRSAAYMGYMRGCQHVASVMANTPEMALAMQRAFETHALTGE